VPKVNGDLIGIIELAGGLGGLRRAIEILGGEPAVGVYVDPDPGACAAALAEWPDLYAVGRVEDISEGSIQKLVASGPHVKVWIIGACLSATSVEECLKLCAHASRIRSSILGATDSQVFAVFESEKGVDRAVYARLHKLFKHKPYKACPSKQSHVRRPRLYWTNFSIIHHEEVEADESDDTVRLSFGSPREPSQSWIDEDWFLHDGEDVVLPTFVPCLTVEANHPCLSPLDLDQSCLQRWKLDNRQFPAYQYRLSAGLISRTAKE